MAKYLLAYKGGSMAETPEEQQKQMEAWMNWFGSLGEAVVDGGAPFGPASTLASNGSVKDGGASALSGYSIINATTLADANDKAKGCPVLAGGGSVEVYEALPMG
ncbi:MAG TPA: hypothetical protein VFZ97_03040 [Acidimicrobiales bacterium]